MNRELLQQAHTAITDLTEAYNDWYKAAIGDEPTQRRTIDELEADNMKLRRLLAFRVGRSHDDALTRRMMVEIAALGSMTRDFGHAGAAEIADIILQAFIANKDQFSTGQPQ